MCGRDSVFQAAAKARPAGLAGNSGSTGGRDQLFMEGVSLVDVCAPRNAKLGGFAASLVGPACRAGPGSVPGLGPYTQPLALRGPARQAGPTSPGAPRSPEARGETRLDELTKPGPRRRPPAQRESRYR